MFRQRQKIKAAAVEIRFRAQACADGRQLVRDVQRRTRRRALVNQSGGEVRQSGAILRVCGAACLDDQIHVDDGQLVLLDDQDLKTVRQLAPLNLRQSKTRICFRLRLHIESTELRVV